MWGGRREVGTARKPPSGLKNHFGFGVFFSKVLLSPFHFQGPFPFPVPRSTPRALSAAAVIIILAPPHTETCLHRHRAGRWRRPKVKIEENEVQNVGARGLGLEKTGGPGMKHNG